MIKRSLDRFSSFRGSSVGHGQSDRLRERLKGITLATRPLSMDLEGAIADGQLFLEFQPTLDWRLKRITGVEALVRWKHPGHGVIPPNRFIPFAAAGGFTGDLTDWIIATAATQVARWHAEELAVKVAVNISDSDLQDRGLQDRLERHCRNASIEPSCLTLEFTESSLVDGARAKINVLTRLQQTGFNLSLDDFGTGSLSSAQLEQIPLCEAKIDLTFVTRMMTDPGCGRVVEILIDTAREFGLTSVAEGVEDDEVLQRLLDLDCDKVQGFYISRPLAADSIPAFVREFESCIGPAERETDQADLGFPDSPHLGARQAAMQASLAAA